MELKLTRCCSQAANEVLGSAIGEITVSHKRAMPRPRARVSEGSWGAGPQKEHYQSGPEDEGQPRGLGREKAGSCDRGATESALKAHSRANRSIYHPHQPPTLRPTEEKYYISS